MTEKSNGRNQDNEERVCSTSGRNSGADWQAGQAWKVIHKRFTEITLKDKHSLRGVIDGRFQSININNRFLKKVEDLGNIFLKYGYLCKVSEKKNEKVVMSIGEFLDHANKFKPRIITRYKGLNYKKLVLLKPL